MGDDSRGLGDDGDYVDVDVPRDSFSDDGNPFTDNDNESVAGSVSLEDSIYKPDTSHWVWEDRYNDYVRRIGLFVPVCESGAPASNSLFRGKTSFLLRVPEVRGYP